MTTNTEAIFIEDTRCTVLPVLYPEIWELYKRQAGSYWQVHEVSLSEDIADWRKLDSHQQHFIKMVLAFFASSDLIINKNLSERFINDVKPLEIKITYDFQKMMENIHSEMYAILIDTYIADADEKKHLLNAIRTIPVIEEMAAWANRWTNSDEPYCVRLIAFAAFEGILFSGPFCSIYWIKSLGQLPGLAESNDFISRDESMHVETAEKIHALLVTKCSMEKFNSIVVSAVDLEIKFIVHALPCKMIGINADSMILYIKYVANRFAAQFNYAEIYPNIEMPFSFMSKLSLKAKKNTFERRANEYSLSAKHEEDPYEDVTF
jgi:ribonucleotide reductase beta subunit family protein with ferritin-like domain